MKHISSNVLIILSCLNVSLVFTSFNFKELRDNAFEVNIGNSPILKDVSFFHVWAPMCCFGSYRCDWCSVILLLSIIWRTIHFIFLWQASDADHDASMIVKSSNGHPYRCSGFKNPTAATTETETENSLKSIPELLQSLSSAQCLVYVSVLHSKIVYSYSALVKWRNIRYVSYSLFFHPPGRFSHGY